MTTADYLTQLQKDKSDLVDNLTNKGISGLTGDETFTELVPEVLNIPSGGDDWSDIGYSSTPESIEDIHNYSKEILDNWDVDNPKIFSGDYKLTILPQIDISNLTTLQNMFRGCYSLRQIKSINVHSGITAMNSMFYDCNNLKYINFNNWNTSNVLNMSSMFYNCKELEEVNLSNLDVSSLTTINSMFSGCTNLKKITFGNNFKNKTLIVASLFSGCNNLETIDLSNINLNEVTSTQYMFRNCKKLEEIDLSHWVNLSGGIYITPPTTDNLSGMFYGCTNLRTVKIGSGFQTLGFKQPTVYSNMFYGCENLQSVDFTAVSSYKSSNASNMFYGCTNLKGVNFMNVYFNDCTNMSNMFYGCTSMKDSSNWNDILNKLAYHTGLASSNKKLSYLGITDPDVISAIQNATNYQQFIDSGWSIN